MYKVVFFWGEAEEEGGGEGRWYIFDIMWLKLVERC